MPFVFWLLLSWQSLSCKLAICVLFLNNSSATSSRKNVYWIFFLFLLDSSFFLLRQFIWFQTSFSSVSNIKIIFHKICLASIFRRKFLKFLSYRIPYRRRLFHFLYLILDKLLHIKAIPDCAPLRWTFWIQNKVWRKTVTYPVSSASFQSYSKKRIFSVLHSNGMSLQLSFIAASMIYLCSFR